MRRRDVEEQQRTEAQQGRGSPGQRIQPASRSSGRRRSLKWKPWCSTAALVHRGGGRGGGLRWLPWRGEHLYREERGWMRGRGSHERGKWRKEEQGRGHGVGLVVASVAGGGGGSGSTVGATMRQRGAQARPRPEGGGGGDWIKEKQRRHWIGATGIPRKMRRRCDWTGSLGFRVGLV